MCFIKVKTSRKNQLSNLKVRVEQLKNLFLDEMKPELKWMMNYCHHNPTFVACFGVIS